MQVLIFIAIVAVSAILAVRYGGEAVPQTRAAWLRASIYWLLTLLVAFEMVSGALWDLLQIPLVRAMLTHLGYPIYLTLILGVWKIPCALAMLAPRFPRLKEWAYAGAVFNYTSAAASHLLAGDKPAAWIVPSLFVALTFASWGLRPAERRSPLPAAQPPVRPVAWTIPVLITAAMLIFALFTLPKAAPHSKAAELRPPVTFPARPSSSV